MFLKEVLGLVGRAMRQDEALVAIAAIDKALLVNLKPDARMAKRGTAGNIGGAIAGDTVGGDADGFRLPDHSQRIASAGAACNVPLKEDYW